MMSGGEEEPRAAGTPMEDASVNIEPVQQEQQAVPAAVSVNTEPVDTQDKTSEEVGEWIQCVGSAVIYKN
jgi:hypothetical protein